MTAIDDAWLAERERVANAATPGPWWRPFAADDTFSGAEMRATDWWFCADARTAVPALIAEVRRLREENDRLRLQLANEIDARKRLFADVVKMREQIQARVKRCHYCDAPMRERDIEKEGVMVGVQYQCSEGCP